MIWLNSNKLYLNTRKECLVCMEKKQEKRIEEYLNILQKEPALYKVARGRVSDKNIDFAKAIYDVVFAPVLVCFVEWVLQEAKKKGIKRLYFLARDGYQMYLVAEQLCKQRKYDIECRYLYGSRYAWRMPQFALMGESCLDMICLGGIGVTFEKVMKRGGLTDEEALTVAKELGFEKKYKTTLSYQEIMKLKQPLAESKQFLPFVYEHSKSAYENTIGYLKQKGLLENVPYALVDSGWVGSLQKTLQQLLCYAGYKKEIEGFYFGLYELPKGVKKENYYTYYFSPTTNIKKKVYFSNCLYEAVYSAPHGMTTAYEKIEETYQPVFYKEYNLNQARMKQMEQWLREFLMEYQKQESIWNKKKRLSNKKDILLENQEKGSIKNILLKQINCNKRLNIDEKRKQEMVFSLLKKLMGNPLKEEVKIYGTLLFSDDVTEEQTKQVADILTEQEIKNHQIWNKLRIMLGMKQAVLKESAWMEGSIVDCGKNVKQNLHHAVMYKYLIYIRKAFKQ